MGVVTDRHLVSLDGVYYPLDGPVQDNLASVFPQKLVIGDFTRDTEQLASNWIQSDFAGGLLVQYMEANQYQDRFWSSTVDTRFTKQVLLNPLVTTTDAGIAGAEARAGEQYGGHLYVAFDTSIRRWVDPTSTWVAPAGVVSLNSTATDALVIQLTVIGTLTNLLVFADGAGYMRFDGTTWTYTAGNGTTIPRAKYLAEWDQRLCALDGNNTVWWSLDASVWVKGATIPIEQGEATGLLNYYTVANLSALHAPTHSGLWVYDFISNTWLRTELKYPRYPTGGVGTTEWQSELYVPVGAAVFRFTGNAVQSMGLDRDWGLPAQLRGEIYKLINAFNWLVAGTNTTGNAVVNTGQLLTGTVTKCAGGVASTTVTGSGTLFTQELTADDYISIPGAFTEIRRVDTISSNTSLTVTSKLYNALAQGAVAQATGQSITKVTQTSLQTGGWYDQAPVFPQQAALSSLFAWTGTGWHTLWTSGTLTGQGIIWGMVATADNAPRLWWGSGGKVYYLTIPRGTFNPRQIPNWTYAKTGTLVTPRFDGGRSELDKTALQVTIRGLNMTSSETIDAWYALDDTEAYTYVGRVSSIAPFIQRLGTNSAGVAFKNIQMKYDLSRGPDSTKSPVMVFSALKYVQRLVPMFDYVFTLDLSKSYGPYDPYQLWTQLITSLAKPTLLQLQFMRANQEIVTRRVLVTTVRRLGYTGDDDRSRIQLGAVEI